MSLCVTKEKPVLLGATYDWTRKMVLKERKQCMFYMIIMKEGKYVSNNGLEIYVSVCN